MEPILRLLGEEMIIGHDKNLGGQTSSFHILKGRACHLVPPGDYTLDIKYRDTALLSQQEEKKQLTLHILVLI